MAVILNYSKRKPQLVKAQVVIKNFDAFKKLLMDIESDASWEPFETMIIRRLVSADIATSFLQDLLAGRDHRLRDRAIDYLRRWKANDSAVARIIDIDWLLPEQEQEEFKPKPVPLKSIGTVQKSSISIAVTGTARTNPGECKMIIARRLGRLLSDNSTWYVGSSGIADETVADYLGQRNQKVVIVSKTQYGVSQRMGRLMKKYGFSMIDADEQETKSEMFSRSARNKFLESHADTIILLWDGESRGIREFIESLRSIGKEPIIETLRR